MKHNLDTIKLGVGKALVIGNKPPVITLDKYAHIETLRKRELNESFGFWDSASPNFQTYYPEVKAEDLQPKAEDYVYPVVRALSEVTVRRSWNPISFAKPGVLKDSRELLKAQTVYPNHEALIGNELGVVTEVEWQESYTTPNGIVVPAGILATLMIDAKANPKTARNIISKPPIIHSVSVTVSFAWEKSHPEMDDDVFWSKIGKTDSEGKLIQRVASEILSYSEISLVPHGADPYAMVVDESKKISNPDYAKKAASLSDDKGRPLYFFYTFGKSNETLSLRDDNDTSEINNNEEFDKPDSKPQNNSKMKDLVALLNGLVAAGSIQLSDNQNTVTEENVNTVLVSALKKGNDASVKLASITDELTQTKNALKTAQDSLSALEAEKDFISVGKEALKSTQEESVRLYKATLGDKADSKVIEELEKASFKDATANVKKYQAELDNSFPQNCGDCGSSNITRMSASAGGGEQSEGKQKPTNKSIAEVSESFMKEASKPSISNLHGEAIK